ncbi:MAG TPA: DUF2637 domain-containing protein [Pseudonocardiaceae bacterium]|nr:DUF2637 domain-containing protein [Pseudonocardiaceae bacterium]
MRRRAGAGGPGWLTRMVAATPVGGALVLSFDGLANLARGCRIDGWLAFLWPITLDATGVVASLIWLDYRMPEDARRAARWLALTAIVLSVGGNGLWHWLIDLHQRPHVLVQIAVGAVPPLVLFAMLHVLQLASRRPAGQPLAAGRRSAPAERPAAVDWLARLTITTRTSGQPATALELPVLSIAGQPADPITERVSAPDSQPALALADRHAAAIAVPASQVAPKLADRLALWTTHVRVKPGPASGRTWTRHIDRARAVLADQPEIGRPALATALGIPTSQARKLLDHLRPNQPALPAGDLQEITSG